MQNSVAKPNKPIQSGATKSRKIRGIVALLCLAIAACVLPFSAGTTARASEATPLVTQIVKPDTDTVYRYFDYPTAVYADGNGFTVADTATAYTFDPSGTLLSQASVPDETDKLALHGITPVTLADGVLRIGESIIGEDFTDFTLANGFLYAVDGKRDGGIYAYPLPTVADDESVAADEPAAPALQCVANYGMRIERISSDRTGVYIAVADRFNRYLRDVIFFPFGEEGALGSSVLCLTASEEILQMDGLHAGGIVCLTRTDVIAYRKSGDRLVLAHSFPCDDAMAISCDGTAVYAIGQLKNIFKIDETFSRRTEILASAHRETGFFRANAGLATRRGMVAVADERNDRVQILRDGKTETVAVPRPKAVAIDYAGNLYVAHNGNAVGVFDRTLQSVKSFAAPGDDTVLTDLKIDSENNLYALSASGQVYKIAAQSETQTGETFENACADTNVTAIAVAQSNNTLFAVTVTDGVTSVVRITGGAQVPVLTAGYDIVDLCTDHDDSLYLLTADGGIVKYENTGLGYSVAFDAPPYQAGSGFVGATAIEMNTVTQQIGSVTLAYGDLLLSDTGAHAVKKIDGAALEVNKRFDTNADVPTIPATPVPPDTNGKGILYRASACEVYAQEAEINVLRELHDGMTVIVPQYDAHKKFTLILADNLQDGIDAAPVTGYVYTSLLSKNPLPYTAPPASTCYTYFPTVTIYKYPSLNAPTIAQYQKGEAFTLLDFAYHDNNGNAAYGYTDNLAAPMLWYHISYMQDGREYDGYVVSSTISMRGETPDDRNLYPRTNARIVSKEKGKDLPATLYEKTDDGQIVPVADPAYPPLAVGTAVEVVGAFDSSEKFTQIKYYHEGIGTVTFYVETINLKYDGVNKVTIIVIVVLIVTVLLCIGLLVRFAYVKRTQKMNVTKL